MTPVGLTKRQAELLGFITERLNGSGLSPSFDEMASHLGLKSKSGVLRLVDALVERGHLVRMRQRARAIALPRSAPQPAERLEPGLQVRLSPYLTQRLESYCRERGTDPASEIDVALHLHIAGGRP